MAVSSYNIAPGQSQAELDMKRKIALALIERGTSPRQIDHWTQGLAQMAEAGLGGYEMAKLDKADKEERAKGNEMLARVLAGGGAAPAAAPAAPAGDFASAISGIESGGKYDALGPVTKTGDRAYGKYQIMGANVPQWTKAHLGQEMDPQAFLANPQAQDAVFKAQFGQYAQKYGPEGAARAWFAGEGGMNDPNRRDQLGTTVAQYGQKFAQALGPQGAPSAPAAPDNRAAIVQMLGNRYTAPIAQQIASGVIGQQFKPQDYDIHHRGDGTVVAVNKKNPQDIRVVQQPGVADSMVKFEANKAGATKRAELEAARAVAEPDKKKQEQQVGSIVTQDIDRTLAKITATPGRTTGTVGQILSGIGGTEAHNVSKLLDTVKSNAGFQELQKMRQASPTGGALGSVTERELALLQSTIGNLEQSQDDKQLADNLRRVKNVYLDIIHGPGNGPAREKLTFQEEPATAPAAPDRAAIEQEMRRRGLLK